MHGSGDVGKRTTAPASFSNWLLVAARTRGGRGGVGRRGREDTARRRRPELWATSAQSHGNGGGGACVCHAGPRGEERAAARLAASRSGWEGVAGLTWAMG